MCQRNPKATIATIAFALRALNANRDSLLEGIEDAEASLLSADAVDALVAGLESHDPAIQVVIDGGLFRAAGSDHPLCQIADVELLDFDVDGNYPGDGDGIATPAAGYLQGERPSRAHYSDHAVARQRPYSFEPLSEDE